MSWKLLEEPSWVSGAYEALAECSGCQRALTVRVNKNKEPRGAVCRACSRGRRTHGHARNGGSKTYRCWQSMKDRCLNSRCKEWKNYGGRGILICERWLQFENFLKDMKELPGPGFTIERIDVNGNYESSNCEWVPREVQACNTRQCRMITWDGRTKTIAEWGRELGIKGATIRQRLDKQGMSIERAFTVPTEYWTETRRQRGNPIRITHNGETLTCHQWAVRLGMSPATILYRYRRGLPPEAILAKR